MDNKKQGNYITNKSNKSKIKTIMDDVFKIGSAKNAAQFSRLLSMADYIQITYNNEVGKP